MTLCFPLFWARWPFVFHCSVLDDPLFFIILCWMTLCFLLYYVLLFCPQHSLSELLWCLLFCSLSSELSHHWGLVSCLIQGLIVFKIDLKTKVQLNHTFGSQSFVSQRCCIKGSSINGLDHFQGQVNLNLEFGSILCIWTPKFLTCRKSKC